MKSFHGICRKIALLFAAWLGSREANAGPSDGLVSPATLTARTEVVLGTIGLRAQPARSSLVALLSAELRGLSLSLAEAEPTEPLSAWATSTARPGRVLAVILLDGRSERGWRLVVIDAARRRAIARSLPGGMREDAASIEAVVSIVVSAASALREGLEVASTPLAAVVGDSPTPPAVTPTKSAVRAAPVDPSATRRGPWAFRGALAASVASFSPAAPTTPGVALALSVSFRARVEARVFGTGFAPALLRAPFGEFRVARAFVGAAAGPVFGAPAFSFAPEAGIVAERVRRYDATPTAGVYATEPSALYRLGGVLALRLRHALLRPVSVELVTGAMYFGRRLEFTAKNADSSWSERVWPAVAFAQLGLEIATN